LPKINAFKQYYVRKQELAYRAHDDIVDCDKGVRTQEIKILGLPLWSFHSRSIFSTNY